MGGGGVKSVARKTYSILGYLEERKSLATRTLIGVYNVERAEIRVCKIQHSICLEVRII